MLKRILLLIIPFALLASGWFFIHTKKVKSQIPSLSQDFDHTGNSDLKENNSPAPAKKTDIATTIADDINSSTEKPLPAAPDQQPNTKIDATTIAADQRLTDEEFEQLELLLRNDKALRLELLEEFRLNANPERAKQLAALLGPHNDPEILQTASALVYSGDPISKTAGLDLLRRIQPRSTDARNIAIDLLSVETDPAFLVSTMNVLATPATSAGEGQRQLLADNLNNLSNHYDPRVRSHSLSLMGRWDKNSLTSRDSLTRGLSDTDPGVRSSAAYAIRNIQNPDDNMIDGLLNIAEDADTKKSTRYAALEALDKMSLSGISIRRYNLAKRNVNRRVANTGN